MTTRQYGKPRSDRMIEAIRRVIDGKEICYRVAHETGITPSYLYAAVRLERERASRRSQVPEVP